jgi:hypothetical protein
MAEACTCGDRTTIVVDSFYDDPDEVREFALSCTFTQAVGSWVGLHSYERAPNTKETLFRIAALLSDDLPNWDEIDRSYQFWRKAACGGFATLFSGQEGIIHAHRRSGDWAAVVFLAKPEDCDGRDGTRFFRHAGTGRTHSCGPDDEVFREALADARNDERWELVDVVPMKYNRLVLFDSRFFHAPSPGFGRSVPDCRLTQVFNFVLEAVPERSLAHDRA